MPVLARHLQEEFDRLCPDGWGCEREVRVIAKDLAQTLGYTPQADVLFQEKASGRRVWVELEISRADPVANHAKFATTHLVRPFAETDTFLSMVSRHVATGRHNLAAHTIGVLRALGMRAFQTVLMPTCDGSEIKRLNHLEPGVVRDEAPSVKPEIGRLFQVARSLGTIAATDIHFAANEVEVFFNVHRWNEDLAKAAEREAWGRRRIRYFVSDAAGRAFAPCKFAAYLRLPGRGGGVDSSSYSLTGMSLAGYREIDRDDSIFDGHRAWKHLRDHLGFSPMPVEEMEPDGRARFCRWAEACGEAVQVDGRGGIVLLAPKR